MPRRIRRPKSKSDLMNKLRDMDQGGPFDTYKDTLVFAAALGFSRHARRSFSDTDEAIDWDVFKSNDRALINIIAIADSQDLTILSDDRFDDKLTLFEEYANGGLGVIAQEVANQSSPIFEGILDLIDKAKKVEDVGDLPDISKITRLIGK